MLTDKEYRNQKKRVWALFNRLRLKLWLGEWEMTMEYCNGPISEEHYSACAVADAKWPYRRATISWNLNLVKDLTDEKLEWVFIHEAMHVIVNEMRDDKKNLDHEERVCSTLANLIQRLVERP